MIPNQREVRLLDHPQPKLSSDDQVLIRSLEVGICGTDKEICSFVYGSPPDGSDYLVLGHESLGEVLEVGSGVDGFKRGDLVVPSVRRPCMHSQCRPCHLGRQDFCATGDFSERGIKLRHGYLTERYIVTGKFLTPVPPNLRDVGVLVEPLTVAEKGLDQALEIQKRLPWTVSKDPANPGKGLHAVVLGAGPVGILGAMALLVRGFKTCVYSRAPKPNDKAELVEALGAEYVSSEEVSPQDLAQQLGKIDLVYEAAGVASAAFDLLQVLGTNGIFIFTGIPSPKPAEQTELDDLNRNLVLKNQVVLGTVNASLEQFQHAVADLGAFYKRWPDALRRVITGRFPMESFSEALHRKGGIKNVIAVA